MQLLDLRFFLSPRPCRVHLIDQIYILVIFAEIFNRVFRQLECYFVGQHQVDMHDVGLNVQQLEPGESLDQRVVVFVKLRCWGLGYHQCTEIPDCRRLGKRLGEAFHMLGNAV